MTMHGVVSGLAKVLFNFEVKWAEKVPQEGPAIIVFNHLHGLDTVLTAAAVPDRTANTVGRRGIMETPVIGWMFRQWGAITIDRPATGRGTKADVEKALDVMRPPLEAGHLELIFGSPNTRTPGKKPARPIRTIARLARETGANVVPAVIKGSDRLRQDKLVAISFGDPMEHPGQRGSDRRFLNDVNEVQTRLFDEIWHPFEYEEPDERIILGQDT